MTETGVEEEAWGYLAVCVPVVVVFAPLGSIVASHFHRLAITRGYKLDFEVDFH